MPWHYFLDQNHCVAAGTVTVPNATELTKDEYHALFDTPHAERAAKLEELRKPAATEEAANG